MQGQPTCCFYKVFKAALCIGRGSCGEIRYYKRCKEFFLENNRFSASKGH